MKEFQLRIIRLIQEMSNPFFDEFFNIISFFGESIFIILIIGFIYWTYDKKFGQTAITVMISSMVFNTALKGVVCANRPFVDDSTIINKRPDTATGYSFPSGHSQTAATMYTLLITRFKQNWVKIVLPILIFLIMFSRMYLGVHYPADVIMGCVFGVLFALLLPKILVKLEDYKWIIAIEILLFVPFAILYFVRQDNINADFFKMYGLLIGYLPAYMYERKYVNFDTNTTTGKKVLRFVIGILILAGIQGGLKYLFGLMFVDPSFTLTACLHMIRYGLISFVGLGLYPHLFKKLNF